MPSSWTRDLAGAARERWLRLGFGTGTRESRPAPQQPKMIPGGAAAPELFMKPMDPDEAAKALPIGTLMPLSGWVQLKLDGIGGGMIDRRIVTPQGSPFNAALHCLPGLLRLEERIGCASVIVGEYVEEEGYDATMAAFQRGEGAGIFWVYDAVPFDQWLVDRCVQPIEERIEILERAFAEEPSPFVGLIKSQLIDEPHSVLEGTRTLWGMGFEGTVVKKRRSLYQRRRSPDWMRLKEVVTKDVLVVDVLHKGGRLAKLICRDPAFANRGEGTLTVATGWNDQEAAALEAMMGLPAGDRWIEVAHNRKAGSREARHIRFVRLRMGKEAHSG